MCGIGVNPYVYTHVYVNMLRAWMRACMPRAHVCARGCVCVLYLGALVVTVDRVLGFDGVALAVRGTSTSVLLVRKLDELAVADHPIAVLVELFEQLRFAGVSGLRALLLAQFAVCMCGCVGV